MTPKRCILFVCGLFTDAGSVHAWANQACVWAIDHVPNSLPVPILYFATVATANLLLNAHADDLAEQVRKAQAKGHSVEIIGHSNGTRITAAMLRRHPTLRGLRITMLAAAIEPDCWANGLNAAADRGQVIKLTFGVSPVDEVVGASGLLGYGDMGKVGPRNLSRQLANVTTPPILRACAHSDWVARDLVATLQDSTQ